MAKPSAISPEAVEEQLDRISRSQEFAKSPQMRRFLQFVVDGVLAGRESELKEYTIALAVFNRPADFDQRTDPVVRNEARRLRRKLHLYYSGEGAADPVLIELPTGGYVPICRLRTADEEVSETQPPVVEAATQDLPTPGILTGSTVYAALFRSAPRGRYAAIAFCIVLVTAALALGLMKGLQPGGRRIHSIAVLPFRNLSADRAIDPLSDGIAYEVLNSLAQVPDLKVVAWTSSVQVKNLNLGIQGAGQKLGVEALLEGTVQSSAGTLRIIPRFVDARNGYQLWSQSYEFQTKNLFEIQDSISRAVTHSLEYNWNPPVRKAIADDGEAYRAFILGGQYLTEAQERTAPASKALSTLQRAVTLDPGNADAWARLAIAYGSATEMGAIAPAEGNEKALRYGDKALEVNPNSPAALAVKGSGIAALHHDWQGGDRLFRRAIELKPSDSFIHNLYAYCVLWPTARLEDAQREQMKALELDPMNAIPRAQLSLTLYFRHQYESAIRVAEEALALSPNSESTAECLMRPLVITRRIDRVTALTERYWRTGRMRLFIAAVRAYSAGDLATAQRDARIALRDNHCPDCEPFLYNVLNDESNMIRAFERLRMVPDFAAIVEATLDPMYDRYRSRPEFQAMMKRLAAPR
jgi:TolB-like protein/Flp pilus assembly protein TadD